MRADTHARRRSAKAATLACSRMPKPRPPTFACRHLPNLTHAPPAASLFSLPLPPSLPPSLPLSCLLASCSRPTTGSLLPGSQRAAAAGAPALQHAALHLRRACALLLHRHGGGAAGVGDSAARRGAAAAACAADRVRIRAELVRHGGGTACSPAAGRKRASAGARE